MLEILGWQVDEADDGNTALARMEQTPYPLVLMDAMMPTIDGYEATRRWRTRETGRTEPRTIIIGLTAMALNQDDASCRAAGMDDCLPKPFTIDQIEAVLTRWTAAAG
jgi:hypothetical protein